MESQTEKTMEEMKWKLLGNIQGLYLGYIEVRTLRVQVTNNHMPTPKVYYSC